MRGKYISLIGLMVLAIYSCHKSKAHHVLTAKLCEYKPNKCACNLYVEVYQVFGMGALGSDLNSEYLTDSVNFRLYLGTYDEEDENIRINCKVDSIEIVKTKKTSSKPEWDFQKVLESKTYNLKDLKKQHKFE